MSKKPSIKNFIRNIPFIISGSSFAILGATNRINICLFALTVLIIVILAFYLENVYDFWKLNISKMSAFVSCVILIIAGLSFYYEWHSAGILASVASRIGLSGTFFAGALTVIGAIVGFYFCSLIVTYIVNIDKKDFCSYETENKRIIGIQKKAIRCLIVVGFIVLIICSFSVSLWNDEAFSLRMIQYSYSEVIQYTAADVHPPLYYILLKFVEDICSFISTNISFRIIVAKLFSVSAYVLTAVLCWKKIKDSESKTTAWLAILCVLTAPSLIDFGIEVRMYSWAVFFVTGTYLYAKDIMENGDTVVHWVLLVIFSLCSAYTHNFALIAMATVWLYLLIWIIRNEREMIKKWFGFGIVTAIGYIPWFIVLMNQVQTVSSDYWIADIDLPTIASYFTYMLPGCFAFVLVAAVYTAYSRVKLGEKVSSGIVGILIPVTTLVIGLLISFIIRPILTSKYLIPGILCLWLGILLLWKKMNKGNQAFIVFVLVVNCIASCLGLATREYSLGVSANNSLELMESLSEEAIICDEEKNTYVIGTYTDQVVYYVGQDSQDQVFKAMFSNVQQIDNDTETFISELLDEGKTVYYFTTGDIENEWSNGSCTSLGTYNFSTDLTAYQITPLEDYD